MTAAVWAERFADALIWRLTNPYAREDDARVTYEYAWLAAHFGRVVLNARDCSAEVAQRYADHQARIDRALSGLLDEQLTDWLMIPGRSLGPADAPSRRVDARE